MLLIAKCLLILAEYDGRVPMRRRPCRDRAGFAASTTMKTFVLAFLFLSSLLGPLSSVQAKGEGAAATAKAKAAKKARLSNAEQRERFEAQIEDLNQKLAEAEDKWLALEMLRDTERFSSEAISACRRSASSRRSA